MIVFLLAAGAALKAQSWPQWGGENRDFHSRSAITAEWSTAGPQELWKYELGDGNSMVVSDGRTVFTMYREWGDSSRIGDEEIIIALDAASGEKKWEHRYNAVPFDQQGYNGERGPNATQLIDDNRLYSIGFTGTVTCNDLHSGKKIWSLNLIDDFKGDTLTFGHAPAPLAYKKTVIFAAFGKEAGLVALDKKSGKIKWRSERVYESYAAPVVARIFGEDQVIMFGRDKLFGFSAKNGQTRWTYDLPDAGNTHMTTPMMMDDTHILLGAGSGTALLKLNKQGKQVSAEAVWIDRKISQWMGNSIRLGDLVIAGNRRILFAFNWKDGALAWRKRGFSEAKMVHLGDETLVLDARGMLFRTRFSDSGAEVIAQFRMFEGRTWTAPTVVGGRLYARDRYQLRAFDLNRSAPPLAAAAMPERNRSEPAKLRDNIEQTFLDGNGTQAMVLLDQLVNSYPDSLDDRWMANLGRLLLRQELNGSAETLMELAKERFPTSGEVYMSLRRVYAAADKTAEVTALDAEYLVAVQVRVNVPQNTPADASVYIVGDMPALGQWQPDQVPLERSPEGHYEIDIKLPRNAGVQYKFTLGSWNTVEKDASGNDIDDRSFRVGDRDGQILEAEVINWGGME